MDKQRKLVYFSYFFVIGLKKGRFFYLESKLRTQWELFHEGSDFFNTNTIVPYVPMVKITDLQLSDINRIGHRVR